MISCRPEVRDSRIGRQAKRPAQKRSLIARRENLFDRGYRRRGVAYSVAVHPDANDKSNAQNGRKNYRPVTSHGHLPDLPPLKWSSLKYVLTMEDEINGEEAAYS